MDFGSHEYGPSPYYIMNELLSIFSIFVLFLPIMFFLLVGTMVGCYFLSRSREHTVGIKQHPGTSLVTFTFYFLGLWLIYVGVSLIFTNFVSEATADESGYGEWLALKFGFSILLPGLLAMLVASRCWKKWTSKDGLPLGNVFVRCYSALGVLAGGIAALFWATSSIFLITMSGKESLGWDNTSEGLKITIVMTITTLVYLAVNAFIFSRNPDQIDGVVSEDTDDPISEKSSSI